MNKIKDGFYGFEEYSIYTTNQNVFSTSVYFGCIDSPNIYYPAKNVNIKGLYTYYDTAHFPSSFCQDHKELLDTADKVYVHPSCSLSRSQVQCKYKKCNNPWTADAVIVPKIENNVPMRYWAVFINEKAKKLYLVRIFDIELQTKLEAAAEGTEYNFFKDPGFFQGNIDVADSVLLYAGYLFNISQKNLFILDILTNSIPADKTVFESSVQESLHSKGTEVTLDILNNIKDMLESSDENTVGVGLKALSMLDYMHYTNSIQYMLATVNTSNYRWNKARNSTSVKFMFKQMAFQGGLYTQRIYAQDFELFKQLLGPNINYANFSFVTVNTDGTIKPKLK